MTLQSSSVLLTGGAGFIGSHVADALIASGVTDLVVVDDLSLGNLNNLAAARLRLPGLEFHSLDLADDHATMALLGNRHFDVCFNLAVIPLPASIIDPKSVMDRNVRMTSNVCELARAGRIKRLIQYSSSEVYGSARRIPMSEDHPLEAETPYAASKVAADALALSYHRTFGINVSLLRPFNNYGPRQNDKAYAGIIPLLLNAVSQGRPFTIHGDGAQTRDFVFVTDTARATLMLAEHVDSVGAVFNIGSGIETSVNGLVNALLDVMGATDHPVTHGPARPGDVLRHLADVRKAQSVLGYRPNVALTQGLRATVDWYRQSAS